MAVESPPEKMGDEFSKTQSNRAGENGLARPCPNESWRKHVRNDVRVEVRFLRKFVTATAAPR